MKNVPRDRILSTHSRAVPDPDLPGAIRAGAWTEVDLPRWVRGKKRAGRFWNHPTTLQPRETQFALTGVPAQETLGAARPTQKGTYRRWLVSWSVVGCVVTCYRVFIDLPAGCNLTSQTRRKDPQQDQKTPATPPKKAWSGSGRASGRRRSHNTAPHPQSDVLHVSNCYFTSYRRSPGSRPPGPG